MTSFRQDIAALRAALLQLPATGDEGFEGLVGIALSEVCGFPFRLASSGSQYGVDGKSQFAGDATSFECKRYDGQVAKNEVLAKITEVALTGDTDLWVIGATSALGTQLTETIRKAGAIHGIATAILDWANSDLPPLAVVLGAAGAKVSDFLSRNIADDTSREKALTALAVIRKSEGFSTYSVRLCDEIVGELTGTGASRIANQEWLRDVFSSKEKARSSLGQPMAPGDITDSHSAPRDQLASTLAALILEKGVGSIVAILGAEGNGKSWLFAQSWLTLPITPLTVVMTTSDFSEGTRTADLKELIVLKVIQQTGDNPTDAARKRWERRLKRWQDNIPSHSPRIVVVIDGLNQRPKIDWGRLIDGLALFLKRIGGTALVTCRTEYFETSVRSRIISHITSVHVPEWSDAERDEILANRNIDPIALSRDVACSLKNPRLLGIALVLLQRAEIENLKELTVSRLLFEHIRTHERDSPEMRPAHEFVRTLRDHAQVILRRAASSQITDIRVFDQEQVRAVADGRFFVTLEGDPTRYTITDEGLCVALALAVVDRLRWCERNDRDLVSELAVLMEPIEALDDVADVLVAAITVVCYDQAYSAEIASAVIGAFADVQNPDSKMFEAFSALAKKRSEPFMSAMERLCLISRARPSFDWVHGALKNATEAPEAWEEMTHYIESWLCLYSLSPDRRMMTHLAKREPEKFAQERARRQAEIDLNMKLLTASERRYKDSLVRSDEGNHDALVRLAFSLIAGKPLAPFADGFAQWCFANALNGGPWAPHKEMRHLISLNSIDWLDAQRAIRKSSQAFEREDASKISKWALANLLRTTGSADDAVRSRKLVADLTAHLDRLEGWRLVEKFCSVDPCDPSSKRPAEIDRTAKHYEALDASKLRLSMGNSREDHEFEMIRTSLARFEPSASVEKHREFVRNVLDRDGLPLRQGLIELRDHNALMDREDGQKLVARGLTIAATSSQDFSDDDKWLISQYCLLIAFPLLTPDEQVDALLALPPEEKILYALGDVSKPLHPSRLAKLLQRAIDANDETAQFRLLAHHADCNVAILEDVRKLLETLLQSTSKNVRTQALAVIARTKDRDLIELVARGGWTARSLPEGHEYEAWYGSLVLIDAATFGLLSTEEAVERIISSLYGRATRLLGQRAATIIVPRMDMSVRFAAGLRNDLAAADFELTITERSPKPSLYSAHERETASDQDIGSALKRMSESVDEYRKRQERLQEAFKAFRSSLTHEKASLVLDALDTEEFCAIATDSEVRDRWYQLFMGLRANQLSGVHNLCLLLGHVLSKDEPDKAVSLFKLVRKSQSFVRMSFGYAGVPLDATTVWSATDSAKIDELRFGRLDSASNDHELALEVLAALLCRREPLLRTYIDLRTRAGEPSAIARGIMVAGFSEDNAFNEGIIRRYQDHLGLAGQAGAAAMYAYVRNKWAAHWFNEMYMAETPAEFWRFSVLFEKIVDGRFETWPQPQLAPAEPFRLFWPSIENMLKNRFKKWREKRNKKLFGADAPDKVYLGLD